MRLLALFLGIALVSGGCSYSVHQVYVSDYAPYTAKNSGKRIDAMAEQHVILGFAMDSNYIENAYSKIQQRCRGGTINGITTQYSTAHGFFSWTNKVLIQGRCIK